MWMRIRKKKKREQGAPSEAGRAGPDQEKRQDARIRHRLRSHAQPPP